MQKAFLMLAILIFQTTAAWAWSGVAGVHNGVMYPCREYGHIPAPPAAPAPNYPPISQAQYQALLRRQPASTCPRQGLPSARTPLPIARPSLPAAQAPVTVAPRALALNPPSFPAAQPSLPLGDNRGLAPKLPAPAAMPSGIAPGHGTASIVGPLVLVGLAAAAVFILHEESQAHAEEAPALEAQGLRREPLPLNFRPEAKPVDHDVLKREYEEYQRQKKADLQYAER